ncbi:MAG: Na-translocating system protein MpsC family protein [Caldilineaceae bacterium]
MKLAKLEVKQPDVSLLLREIADKVATEWAQVRGQKTSSTCTFLNPQALSLVLRNALTTAELNLAGTPTGRMLVQRQISQVMDRLYPQLATTIEAKLHCYVGGSAVTVDPITGNVRFTIELREARRLHALPQPLTVCA